MAFDSEKMAKELMEWLDNATDEELIAVLMKCGLKLEYSSGQKVTVTIKPPEGD